MKSRGIEYEEKWVDRDPKALEEIKELGHLSVPVVVTPTGEHWSGLRPEKIEALEK